MTLWDDDIARITEIARQVAKEELEAMGKGLEEVDKKLEADTTDLETKVKKLEAETTDLKAEIKKASVPVETQKPSKKRGF